METTPYSKLYSKFLDDKEIACRIYEMLANDVLGKEQLEKIKLRSQFLQLFQRRGAETGIERRYLGV